MIFGYILDMGKYILLLMWTPSLDDTWLVFLIAVAEGMVDGVLQLSAQGNMKIDMLSLATIQVALEFSSFHCPLLPFSLASIVPYLHCPFLPLSLTYIFPSFHFPRRQFSAKIP